MSKMTWKDILEVLNENQIHMNDIVTVYHRDTGTEYFVELVNWQDEDGTTNLGIIIGD